MDSCRGSSDAFTAGEGLNFPKPSPELSVLLRYTAEKRNRNDLQLVPVPPELYKEANEWFRAKYGKAFTRESMLLNGHLITPQFEGDIIPAEIKIVGITIDQTPKAEVVQPLLESDC